MKVNSFAVAAAVSGISSIATSFRVARILRGNETQTHQTGRPGHRYRLMSHPDQPLIGEVDSFRQYAINPPGRCYDGR